MSSKKLNTTQKLDEDKLQKLYTSTLKFLKPQTLKETFTLIADESLALTGADYISIFLREGTRLKRIFARPPELFENRIREKGFTFKAFIKKGPSIVRVSQIQTIHPKVKQMGIKATLYVPLTNKNLPFGLIAVDYLHDKISFEDEMTTLKLFSTVAALAIRKAQLYTEVEQALEDRDLFISLAAHEMRTPLTVLLLYSDLLNSSVSKNEKIDKKWLDLILHEANHLKYITDELLSMEQIKSGQLQYHFKQINFTSLLENTLASFQISHTNDVQYVNNINEDIQIIADQDKLIQVIDNILNNASKFSPKDSPIHVTLAQKGNKILLSIKDSGIGIAKADLKKIFDRYYQKNSPVKKGLGLGLYLAKIVLKMHQGQIQAKSKNKHGTELILTLPKLRSRNSAVQTKKQYQPYATS